MRTERLASRSVGFGGFRPETIRALAASWPEMAAGLAAGRPDVPILFAHGEDDPVVHDRGRPGERGLAAAGAAGLVPADLHVVLNEHDRDVVHEHVAAFAAASMDLAVAAA